jgi:hypothetical protein
MNYNGTGTLLHLVKEENQKRDLIKNQKLVESGEYFKSHPYQPKDDENHDVDFKTKPEDYKNSSAVVKKIQRKDAQVEGNDTVEKKQKEDADGKLPEPEEKKNWGNLEFYMKKYGVSEKDDSGDSDLDSSKYIKQGMYKKD